MSILISLLILCLVLAVLWWILSMIIPHLPEPVRWVAQVIFALICLIALISMLTGSWAFPVVGHQFLR